MKKVSKSEAALYQVISSSLAHIGIGNNPEDLIVDIPLIEISEDEDPDVVLRVHVKFEWTSFEEIYYQEMLEESKKEIED